MRTSTRSLIAVGIAVTLAVVVPAVAIARPAVLLAPRGNSGITQYAEVVPTDEGATPPRAGGAPGGAPARAPGTSFDRLGADGRTLAAVVRATAPVPFSTSTRAHAASSAAAPVGPRDLSGAGARSAFASIADAALVPGAGVLGAILLLSAVAFVVRSVRRRRASP